MAAAPHRVTATVEEDGSYIPFYNAENHIGSQDCPVPSSCHQLSEVVLRALLNQPALPSCYSHSVSGQERGEMGKGSPLSLKPQLLGTHCLCSFHEQKPNYNPDLGRGGEEQERR